MSADRIHSSSSEPRLNCGRGFTLIELLMTTVVVALLAAITLPSYARVVERQRVGQAERDLRLIALRIENYRIGHGSPPLALSELDMTIPKDPWGNDYQFLNFLSPAPGVNGKIRKDHNLHPLNSEFDLYSVGPDGSSVAPLTARASRDDIIWARDGAFVGPAADY
jgi:general secretion pathway protein G